MTLIASPDEMLEVSGTLNDIKNNYWVDGSENSLWIKLLNFQITRTITLTDSLKRSYQALPQGTEYDAQRQEYAKAWEEAIKQTDRVSPELYYQTRHLSGILLCPLSKN